MLPIVYGAYMPLGNIEDNYTKNDVSRVSDFLDEINTSNISNEYVIDSVSITGSADATVFNHPIDLKNKHKLILTALNNISDTIIDKQNIQYSYKNESITIESLDSIVYKSQSPNKVISSKYSNVLLAYFRAFNIYRLVLTQQKYINPLSLKFNIVSIVNNEIDVKFRRTIELDVIVSSCNSKISK
jgi:hypothetical protein